MVQKPGNESCNRFYSDNKYALNASLVFSVALAVIALLSGDLNMERIDPTWLDRN